MTALDFYYEKRDCPECVGYQKNCDHFWAGHVVGREVGRLREQERIIKLLEVNDHYSVDWLIELIKGANE